MVNTAFKPAAKVVLGTALLLTIPLLTRAPWSPGDFMLAAAMLLSAGTLYQVAVRTAGDFQHKLAAAAAVGTGLFLLWSNLAVGIVGDDDAINLVFMGVLAIELFGAIAVRFKPAGMVKVLFACAAAQAIIGIVVAVLQLGEPIKVACVNAMFVVLFSAAAILYKRVADRRRAAAN